MNNLFLLPSFILANTISPLAFVFMSRLIFGNFIIGVIEGLIIFKILSATKKRAIWIMILANYVSMFAGLIVIDVLGLGISCGLFLGKSPLCNAFYVILFMPVFAYIVTVLMEWPFCHWININKPKSKKRSFIASLTAQTVSYALILPFYFLTSDINLYRQTTLDPTLSFAKNPNAWIYYISTEDNFLYRCRTNGTSVEKVYDQNDLGHRGLFVWPDNADGTLELWYGTDYYDSSKENKRIKILDNLPWDGSLPTWYRTHWYRMINDAEWQDLLVNPNLKHLWETESKYNDSIDYYDSFNDEIADYRPQEQKEWHIAISPFTYLGRGLKARDSKGSLIDISFHTPYVIWGCSNATGLPPNQVVCQLGWEMVILLDLDSRKIGMVARGHSPVVVFEKIR
jgi:hypothetical protein